MSRILAALCVSAVLSGPALAEGQYQFAKPSPQCLVRGAENADKDWQEDIGEAGRIQATGGRILRELTNLSIRLDTGRSVTFGNLLINEGDDCSLFDSALYSFQRLIEGYAIIAIVGYEYRGTVLVDMTSGGTFEIDADELYLSGDNRVLILTTTYDLMDDLKFTVYELSRPLKAAQITDYRLLNQPVVWTSPETAEVQLYRYKDSEVFQTPAHATITPDGISVRIEKTGEILTAPFKPVSP